MTSDPWAGCLPPTPVSSPQPPSRPLALPFHLPSASLSTDLSAIRFHHFVPCSKPISAASSPNFLSLQSPLHPALPDIVFPGPSCSPAPSGPRPAQLCCWCSAPPPPRAAPAVPRASSRPGTGPSDSRSQFRSPHPAACSPCRRCPTVPRLHCMFSQSRDDGVTVRSVPISPSGLYALRGKKLRIIRVFSLCFGVGVFCKGLAQDWVPWRGQ